RSVGINDNNPESTDYRMTKDGRQHYEGKYWHGKNQNESGPVMQDPKPFPTRNRQEPWLLPRIHGLPHWPIQVSAHTWTKSWHVVDRVCTNRECAQVEIACRAGSAPTRIFAFGGDEPDCH